MPRIGIIGSGYWGKHHLRIFSKLPCELIGIADIDSSKASIADEYKIRFYRDYRKLLNDVDAVSIVTPPSTHFGIANYALKKNKHVFIEKPFVLNRNEAIKLIKLSKDNNNILMVGHIYLYHPAIRYLKKIITKGELGRIYYLISQRLNLGIIRSDVNSLWNFGPHDISILLYLLGSDPQSVSCIGSAYIQENIEDVSMLTLKFPRGILAHIIVSWLHPAKIRELTIVGSRKMAVFNDVARSNSLNIYDKGIDIYKVTDLGQWKNFAEFKTKIRFGNVSTPKLDTTEPLQNELRYFLKSVQTANMPLADGLHGLKVVSILTAASLSMKKGGKTIAIKY